MSKVLQKRNHWITSVSECAVIRDASGELSVELRGGAENGEFPYIGQVKEDAVVYQDGKLCEGDLLLEVEGLPVSGLPLYDILSLTKCYNGPVRLKTVRQGKKNKVTSLCDRQTEVIWAGDEHTQSRNSSGSCFIIALWHSIINTQQNGDLFEVGQRSRAAAAHLLCLT